MAKFQIVLADRDEDYISLLELRFLEHFGNVADIQLISDPIYFEAFFSKPQRIDMLILNEEFYSEALERHSVRAIIRLNEVPVAQQDDESATKNIILRYKYTGMKELFAELAPYLQDVYSREMCKKARLICVYSPVGGVGTTTLAVGLAGALANLHRSVFYLNAETIQSAGLLLNAREAPSASFCSAFLSGVQEVLELLPTACGSEKFDYLLPFKHSVTTLGITLTHFLHLAEKVKENGQYDFIVMDCSAEFTQEKAQVMSVCDRVVILLEQTEIACWKMETLLRDINIRGGERFLFACNRYKKEMPNRLTETLLGQIPGMGYIEYLSDEICTNSEHLAKVSDIARLALQIL